MILSDEMRGQLNETIKSLAVNVSKAEKDHPNNLPIFGAGLDVIQLAAIMQTLNASAQAEKEAA